MNELLFAASILAVFTIVVYAGKYYGKTGLTVWVAIATMLANVIVPKQITLFGIDVTLGNIMFSSTYLCTDILSETEGFKASKRAVNIGLLSACFYIAFTQVSKWFIPNTYDYTQTAIETLFTLSARVTVASVVMFFIANVCDVYLFEFIKKICPKHLWLRNNISTITCNCLENFAFTFCGFLGVYDAKTCAEIALNTCIIEIIVGICDTPFCYWGRKVYNQNNHENGCSQGFKTCT